MSRFYVVKLYGKQVHALIIGPKSPALSTMKKRFHKAFDVREEIWTERAAVFYARLNARAEAMQRIEAAGFVGNSLGEQFIDWLIKQDVGFKLVEFTEVDL